MGLIGLHDDGSWSLYIDRSLFGLLSFFVASLVCVKVTSCFVIRGNFRWS